MKKLLLKLPAGSRNIIFGSVGYLILMHFLTGLRSEHFIIILLINSLFFLSASTRKFVLSFAIFVVFGILYDIMRVFPNYMYKPVDISGLYHLEKNLFGIGEGITRMTLNEYFSSHHSMIMDVITGFFYINWIPIPLIFAAWLYFNDKKMFIHFSLTFLFVNLTGFAIYYIHPAAPPWYVDLYGFEFHTGISGNTAGFSRFDELIGIPVFHTIYGRNANVFAALPSLHSAYPVIVLYYSVIAGPWWLRYLSVIFMTGIWLAAIYSGHHYIIDVLLGVLCASAGILIYNKFLLADVWLKRFTKRYLEIIS